MVFLILCVDVLNDVIPIMKMDGILKQDKTFIMLSDELARGYILPKLIYDFGRPFEKEDITSFLRTEEGLPFVMPKSGEKVFTLKSGEHDIDIREEVERTFFEMIVFKNTLPLIKELQELSKKSIDKTDINYHKELERKKLEGKMKIMMKRMDEFQKIKIEIEKKGR